MITVLRPKGLLDPRSLEMCCDILKHGGIVCYPSETFYALGLDPWNEQAREKLYSLKGRSAGKDLPCIAADSAMVTRFCDTSDPRFSQLADRYWPGPLTIVLPVLNLDATLAVRVSSHPIAHQLSQALRSPIVSTSANLSGQPSVADPEQLPTQVREGIDVLIDAGITVGGLASTIVSLVGVTRILREGAIPPADVLRTVEGMRR